MALSLGKALVCAAAVAAVAYVVWRALEGFAEGGFTQALVALLVAVAASGATYVGAARLLRLEELGLVWRRAAPPRGRADQPTDRTDRAAEPPDQARRMSPASRRPADAGMYRSAGRRHLRLARHHRRRRAPRRGARRRRLGVARGAASRPTPTSPPAPARPPRPSPHPVPRLRPLRLRPRSSRSAGSATRRRARSTGCRRTTGAPSSRRCATSCAPRTS